MPLESEGDGTPNTAVVAATKSTESLSDNFLFSTSDFPASKATSSPASAL